MIELLYGEDIQRDGFSISFSLTRVARRLRLRPQRLWDTLEWLSTQGLIKELQKQRRLVRCTLKRPKGAKS